jgi:hypothetical protein
MNGDELRRAVKDNASTGTSRQTIRLLRNQVGIAKAAAEHADA